MDHVPFPQGVTPPTVPFVGSLYDGKPGSFARYDVRKEMRNDMKTYSFVRVEPAVYQAFFQTWLYFGCLAEVSDIISLSIDATRFIERTRDGAQIVTSASLNEYLDRWRAREKGRTARGSRTARRRQGRLNELLRKIRKILRGPLQRFRRFLASLEVGAAAALSTWTNIALSIAALGYALQQASNIIYGPPGGGSSRATWGVQWALRERLEGSHWCRALIAKFLAEQHVDFALFVGSVPFPRRLERHDRCTDTICRGRIANSEAYETVHVVKGCACNMWVMDGKAAEIVRAGGIPLATWSDEEGLRVVKYQADTAYVAISHVWSDGKGNRLDNGLPECQLKSIQAKVSALYAVPRAERSAMVPLFGPRTRHKPRDPHRQPVGFWMDTLCVPVGEAQKDLRRMAILQMRDIYEGADRVLMLDDRVQKLSLTNSSFCDRAVGLIISNWQSRIWTLQEGIMAQQLFIQFSDGVCTLRELQDEERRRYHGRVTTVGHSRGTASSSHRAFWHRVTPNVLTILSIGLLFAPEDDDANTFTPDALFGALIPVAKNRLTSWREDETICLSALTRLDQRPLLEIRWQFTWEQVKLMPEADVLAEETRVCAERMELFLSMTRRFDKNIIFNELPRLAREGFRWAPLSFLGQAGVTEFIAPEWFHNMGVTNRLERRAPILFKDNSEGKPGDVLGLLVNFPGVMLHSFSGSLISAGTFYVRQKRFKRLLYRVSLQVQQPGVAQATNPEKYVQTATDQYALVTLGAATSDRGSSPIPAVFGVFAGMRDKRVRLLRHVCLATVQVLKTKPEKNKGKDMRGTTEEEFEEGEAWTDEDSDCWEPPEIVNQDRKDKKERSGDGSEDVDSDEMKDDGVAQGIQRSETGSGVVHLDAAGADVGKSGQSEGGNTDQQVDDDDDKDNEDEAWYSDIDEEKQDDKDKGDLNEHAKFSADGATSEEEEEEGEEHGWGAGSSELSSDDDSSDDDDEAEDDLYAKQGRDKTSGSMATGTPKPEEIVYGKLLFMDNNRWCIM